MTMYGINPFFQWDTKYAGTGLGFHFGDLLRQTGRPAEGPINSLSSVDNPHFYPQIYLRLGRMDRIFCEMSFARNFPSSFTDLTFQANIGFSFRKNHLDRGVFRVGTSTATSLFISSAFPVGEHFVMEPYIGFISPILGAEEPLAFIDSNKSDKATIGSIALHYKFGKKPVKDKSNKQK